ncbi:DUF6075 family protein [Thermoanaerobacter sp. YS13]|uniref:DUF6075 family protein n=1 Tax=Thermoanaerobacter sp. YS13 TaxID=1511746 RepID=UPI00068ADF3A|nr:DUF6075 family protein [Thermoanaerobacter sp. YS13]
MYEFISKAHEQRFFELLARDNTRKEDIERQSLFYLLSGIDSLYYEEGKLSVEEIYDFSEHTIKPECLAGLTQLTREERKLIALAFNLYNNFSITPLEAFHGLSKEAFDLAISAIALRCF